MICIRRQTLSIANAIGIVGVFIGEFHRKPGRCSYRTAIHADRHTNKICICVLQFGCGNGAVKFRNHFIGGIVPSRHVSRIYGLIAVLRTYSHADFPVVIGQRIVRRSFVVKHGGYGDVVLYALPIVTNKVAHSVSDNGIVLAPRILIIWPCRRGTHAKIHIMIGIQIFGYAAFAVGIAYCPAHELVLFAVLQPVAYFHVARVIAANVALFGFFGELLARVRPQHNLAHFRVARFNGQLERYAEVRR